MVSKTKTLKKDAGVKRKKHTKKEKKKQEERPYYEVGTILVTKTFNGRSRYCYFYKVIGHTKTKAPRVVKLSTTKTRTVNDPLQVTETVIPNIVPNNLSSYENMRWYSSSGQYLPTDIGSNIHGCGYASTEIYDPLTTYVDDWLSS